MKEVTYGWYPSAQDIYRPKGRPSSYHLECLYKYNNSMYYQDKALPPKPELFVRGVSSGTPPPTPEDLRRRAKSVPVPKFTPTPKLHIPTPAECWARNRVEETKWGVVGDETTVSPAPPSELSWPLTKDRQHQKDQLQRDFAVRSTLQSTWDHTGSVPHPPSRCGGPVSPPMMWPTAQNTDHTARPQTASTVGQKIKSASSTQSFVKPEMTPAPPSRQSSASSSRPPRTQSATVRRVKTTLPSRPVTAGPNRPSSVERIKPASAGSVEQRSLDNASLYEFQTREQKESHHTEAGGQRESTFPKEEVSVPTKPFVYDVNDMRTQEIVARMEKVVPAAAEGDDYDTLVAKYGWRAQIPGDPFKFRKPQLKLRYAVHCLEPELLPEPPSVHMESKETFFYNTIPKRPLSFTVSKEWMSEVLLAKRLELQKRDGGIKYNYKNFAFVY